MRIARTLPCLLVTVLLTLAAPPDSRAQAPAPLLIKGATIIDGVADAPLRDRSLLIEGNTIREVLPADAAAPAGAQVLDLSGKFIIPGLFDSHVHREDYMGELYHQSRRDLDRRAGERTQGVAREEPGRPGPSAVLSPRRPVAALQ